MPAFGAHLSIAGGHPNACESAKALGLQALQIFTSSPSQWASKPITDPMATAFKDAVDAARLQYVVVHDSYLINLAAPDDAMFEKSIVAFSEEIQRTWALGVTDLVMHPGAHNGSGDKAGLKRVVAGLYETG